MVSGHSLDIEGERTTSVTHGAYQNVPKEQYKLSVFVFSKEK